MLYRMSFKSDDGDVLVAEADSRDVLAWERQKSGRSARKLATDWEVGDFYNLAFIAATRTGVYTATLREFEKTHRMLRTEEIVDDVTGEVDEGGPTNPDR